MHNIETLTNILTWLITGNTKPATEAIVKLLSAAREEEAAFTAYCEEQERQENELGYSLPF